MNKYYKPTAFRYSEGEGLFTRHCSTKEIAQKKMQELVDDDGDGDLKIHIGKIEIKRMYYCNHCSYFTIDEPICNECGEELSSVGRKTFTYDLE